ncbi:MAG: glutamate mutase L [Deltaproteobacteria bacterium]|nr:glutamate mutase L [Deltaproteobacteria bacterium]
MRAALLIDFGSTFTKVTSVDLDGELILGRAQSPTTVDTDITLGLNKAMHLLKRQTGSVQYAVRLGCSSAAGGLRMVTVGLVPDLTAEAAKRAALGAGAKIIGIYAHQLSTREVRAIEELKPDLMLLAGGTDGGNQEVIVHNAKCMAGSSISAPIIVAGNKVAFDEIAHILQSAGKEVIEAENVMPEIGVLKVEPAREAIRKVFIERIVEAKGLKRAETYIDGILMPTPSAVLHAAGLMARGAGSEPGLGNLMVVDVGGATTDVHSVGEGRPKSEGVVCKGLPEPYLKRTVEGDLGLRYNAVSLLEAVGTDGLGVSQHPQEVEKAIRRLSAEVDRVARSTKEMELDEALAAAAVRIAVGRHVGYLEPVYMPHGQVFIQYGKDCTDIRQLIATGGIFAHHPDAPRILRQSLYSHTSPLLLKPRSPRFLVDSKYIMHAVGLLEEIDPEKALRIGKKYMTEVSCH